MARYSSWKGYLRISLVSIPVRAYTASSSSGATISLNQLHEKCHSRIQYKKTCPIHGEVPNDEIVSGYEYTKGQYVVIDADELEKLRTEKDRNVNVDTFVKADTIDSLYHSGKNYYLLPDGPVGQKPYQLVHESMLDKGVHAVGQVVISKKEELVLVRPIDRLLVMTPLSFASEIKEPASFFDELVESNSTKQELQLTNQLIGALTAKKFDLARYHDVYTEKLTQLIEAKVAGQEIVAPPASEEPHVINLMDAIKASMKEIEKPTRKGAASKSKQRSTVGKPPARKRKSG